MSHPETPRRPRGRGRPKTERPQHDYGTPELIMKRLLGETTETLDLCLERGIITHRQHRSGVHFRWLYTLRHGAPSVRATDPTDLGGIDIKNDDPAWRAAREQEYHLANRQLGKYRVLLTNICIHNERPTFLQKPSSVSAGDKNMKQLDELRTALDILVNLWRKPATPSS